MRPSRVLVLVGLAASAAGLYLPSVDTDAAVVERLSGAGIPPVWDSMDGWVQIVGVVLTATIVVLVFRPRGPRSARRLAALGIGALTIPMGYHAGVSYRAAGRAARTLGDGLDLAVLSGLVAENPGAGAGASHFVILGGLVLAGIAGAWELLPLGAGAGSAGEGDGAPVE